MARNLSFQHIIVNHTTGFPNENGDNTNAIENLWSHLKSELRLRHGVLRSEMQNFINEFAFRKYFIEENNCDQIHQIFIELIRFIFN